MQLGGIMFCGMPLVRCPAGRCLSLNTPHNAREAISLYLVEQFQWNLTHIFIIQVDIAEKVFKVRGQRSKVKVTSKPTELRHHDLTLGAFKRQLKTVLFTLMYWTPQYPAQW